MNKDFKATLFQMQTGVPGGHYDSMAFGSDAEIGYNRRIAAFVLVASDQGTMIVNRFDYKMLGDKNKNGYGVGYALLTASTSEPGEIEALKTVLTLRCRFYGEGVRVLDIGANIGVHTICWAKHMIGWGTLLAVEPQEPLYYALCGNIVINNCVNAKARWAACGKTDGCIDIPQPDYTEPGTYGSLELRKADDNEDIGQQLDYENNLLTVPLLRVDTFNEPRVDFIKIDVENMEAEVLEGAEETIARCHPVLMVEVFKSTHQQVFEFLTRHEYHWFQIGWSILAIHKDDQVLPHIKWVGPYNDC